MLGRLALGIACYPRRSPFTTAYGLVLVGSYVVVWHLLDPRTAARVLATISTDVDNLERRPIVALFGSPLVVVVGGVAILNLVLVNGVGVLGCLGWLERRYGAARAF